MESEAVPDLYNAGWKKKFEGHLAGSVEYTPTDGTLNLMFAWSD